MPETVGYLLIFTGIGVAFVLVNLTVGWFLRPSKMDAEKGTIYEIQQNFKDEQIKENTHYDRTAVLKLEALNQNSIEFKVEENTTFGLPSDSPKKDYLLKSVTPEAIEVEYTAPDGTKKTVQIPKR